MLVSAIVIVGSLGLGQEGTGFFDHILEQVTSHSGAKMAQWAGYLLPSLTT